MSLITLGDARGHGKSVDKKTLETVLECARQYGDGLRVKFNPNTFTHGAGSLAGFIPPNTLRIGPNKDRQLSVLGDVHLYEHFPNEAKEYLHEIAERTPGNVGLSIEFTGDDEDVDGQKFARCDEIFAATIVDLPAANPTGLFAAADLTNDQNKIKTATTDETNEDTSMTAEQVTELFASLSTLKTTVQKLDADMADMKKQIKATPSATAADQTEDEKQEYAAAGVTDNDDEATKKDKLEKYRALKAGDLGPKVTAMSVKELQKLVGDTVTQTNMQFFRSTGGKPAKVTVEPGDAGKSPFEARIQEFQQKFGAQRGLAIARCRRSFPKEYNEWMAGFHTDPNKSVQTMVRK